MGSSEEEDVGTRTVERAEKKERRQKGNFSVDGDTVDELNNPLTHVQLRASNTTT
jgi:hypothetical protein